MSKQNRRDFVKNSAKLAALTAIASESIGIASASNFDWKKFKGQKIEVIHSKSPRADILMRNEKEFEELTGIQVGSEQIPEQQHRQKQIIEFTSGNPTFDVTSVSWHVMKRLFGKGKFLHDLRDFMNDRSMTSPDYDINDFSKAGMVYATQADGRIDTVPLVIDYWIIFYNKKLFFQAGIDEFPNTLHGLIDAASAVNDPKNGVYGWVARGIKNANTPVWTSFLLGWDTDSVDSDGNLNTTTEEAIEAAHLYTTLNKKYAPQGVVGFNWYECQTTFSQGNAGMWFDGIGFAPPLEDPTKSKISGDVGYAVVPRGPYAQHSGMFGSGMGISNYSKNKEAAWYYCQWATNKLNQARLLMDGAGAPCRNSSYRNKKALSALKVPIDWVDALVDSGNIGRPGLPVIQPVTEFRDVFGIGLTNMILGKDPEKELIKATKEFEPILKRSER